MRAQLTLAIAAITAISASHALAQTATSSAQSGSSSATKAPYACGDDVERHRFDFWLGAWNVTTEGGTKVGESVIETASNGCAILENWAGARGGRGKSLNSYNPEQKQWLISDNAGRQLRTQPAPEISAESIRSLRLVGPK